MATVNRPIDVREKEADVNRKLQLYGIINAFQNGKVPSNDQIDVALNSFLASKALTNTSDKLSADGKALVADVREVVIQARNLVLSKNEGNLLQDFIWQTQQFEPKEINVPGAPVNKQTAKQHGNEALEGLRTLGTLLITNGQFRKLLSDASVLLRDMAGNAATNAAARIKPSEEAISQIDRPADNNTWHDTPDVSKDSLLQKIQGLYKGDAAKDAQDALAAATSAAHSSGSDDVHDLPVKAVQEQQAGTPGVDIVDGVKTATDIIAEKASANVDSEVAKKAEKTEEKFKSKAREYRARTKGYLSKKMPQERREQIIWRLKKMMIECQQHPDYKRAIQTLLNLAEQYGDHANRLAKGGVSTVEETRSSLALAEADLKTLIERFANGTSTDDLWESVNTIYKDADQDEELKGWFRAMNNYIRLCLQEQGYILEDESTQEWNRLYDQGNFLFRNKYRAHIDGLLDELKFIGNQFDEDVQNKSLAAAVSKLFKDLGNDEGGKPTFKPHLIKDLTDVILPAIFEKAAYIPIPRIEFSDPETDIVIENLVLESDNFMPNVLEIATENYIRWGRKTATNISKHAVDVKVSGMQMDLRDVSYYIKRKQGFPAISDTGVANIILPGAGFSFRMKMSSADVKDSQMFFKVDKVDVKFKKPKIKIVKSMHKVLLGMAKPVALKVIRPAMQKALEKAIKDQFNQLDALLFKIKQDAQLELEAAANDPDNSPNKAATIYSRYWKVIQNRLLQGKKQAEVATTNKIKYAVTREESIFPNVSLPGGISSKATEYKELARKGDKWDSPVFSIGSAAKSKASAIPATPIIKKRSHGVVSINGNGTLGASA